MMERAMRLRETGGEADDGFSEREESDGRVKGRRVKCGNGLEEKAGFCCPHHQEFFESGFESDDEYVPRTASRRAGKLSFLSDIPFDAKHYLVLNRDKRNQSSQCSFDSDQSLLALASSEVRLEGREEAGARVVGVYGNTLHLPEYLQPKLQSLALSNQFPEVPLYDSHPVECPYCSQRFSSGQALGGHTSRRHSSKRPSKTFEMRPKRRRLLSITDI